MEVNILAYIAAALFVLVPNFLPIFYLSFMWFDESKT